MELADVLDSKSSGSDTVRVRPPLPAPRPDTARYVSYRAGVRFFFCFRQENAPCCCRAETTDTAHPCTDARTGGIAIFGGDTASRAVGGSGRGLSPALTARPCLPCNLLPPSPRPPSPVGKGEILAYFAGGFAPGTPTSAPNGALRTGRFAVLPNSRRKRNGFSLPFWVPETLPPATPLLCRGGTGVPGGSFRSGRNRFRRRLTDCRPSGGTARCRGCCPCRSHT